MTSPGTIPLVRAGEVARASEQNALISQVNTNTQGISSNSTAIDTAGGILTDHGNRITALEDEPSASVTGLYYGQWKDNNTGLGVTAPVNTSTKVVEYVTPVGTPNGCSISNGSVTVNVTGKWDFRASAQYTGQNNAVRALFFSLGDTAKPSGTRYGLLGGPKMDAQSISAILTLTAGQKVSVYMAHWDGGDQTTLQIWAANTNLITCSYIGP